MADLKSPWAGPPVPNPEPAGAGVLDRGGDPNAVLGGTSALQDHWAGAVTPVPAGGETGNASGLPPLPARWEPSGTPPAPPSLQDRVPGTIDER